MKKLEFLLNGSNQGHFLKKCKYKEICLVNQDNL